MRKLLGTLVSLFIALAASQAWAQHPARNIDELMRKSGLWKQVAGVHGNIRADAARMRAQSPKGGPGDLDDASFERVVKALERAYAPDRLRELIAGKLATILSLEDERTVLAWLDSNIGRRMTAIEEARDGATGDYTARLQAAVKYYESAPKERRELAERFAAALSAGESEFEMLSAIALASLYGVSLADPRIDETAIKRVKETLQSQRPQAVAALRKISTATYAYTYREVPIEDVTRYVEFIDSPVGLRYHDATRVAVREALARASIDLGRIVTETAPKNPSRS